MIIRLLSLGTQKAKKDKVIPFLVSSLVVLAVLLTHSEKAEAKCHTHKCWHKVSLKRHRDFPKNHPERYRHLWNYSNASWYGPGFIGHSMACGGTLDSGDMVVAHKTMACGTRLIMCASSCANVTVMDRGPYVAGRDFDLAPATKNATGFGSTGVVKWRYAH